MKLAFLRRAAAPRPIGIALLLAAAASVVVGREHPAAPAPQAAAPAPALAAAPDIDLGKLRRAAPPEASRDPFAPRSFAPPAPPAAQAQAPAQPPSAPPLPFAYAGRLTAEGRTEVFLLRGEELISIAPGHKIDAEYRVDAISESSIRFTYLPLKAMQSLEITEAGG